MFGLIGFLVVGAAIALWVMAGNLASPERRELQDYHLSYLDGAEDHGVIVVRRAFADGKVPYLTVRPDRVSGPAKRGAILRRQLEDEGMGLPKFGEEMGLLVLLHGRNGRKEDLLPVAERFCAVGFVCVIPDLPSHGESSVKTVGFGVREFEKSLAGRAADEAKAVLSLDDLPEYLWGMSMGGSFAIHAVAEEPERWGRLVIVSSFDRLEGVVEDSLGMFSGILRPVAVKMIQMRGGPDVRKVEPVALAGKLALPTLVIHGNKDDLISHERGENLFGAFAGRKNFVTVPGGNHDNVLITEAPVYAEMAKWFLSR